MSDSTFLDTTILTDVLLKPQKEGRAAKAAIKKFSRSLLPQYAIKEFKAGPLRNFIWFYNKVASCDRYEDAVAAIPLLWRQVYKMSTALQAVTEFESSIGKRLPAELAEKYPKQTEGVIRKAEASLWLKSKVLRAWRNRSTVATELVEPLACYSERPPIVQSSGLIDDKPVTCGVEDCCLRVRFAKSRDDVSLLLNACDKLPERPEVTKRRQALRKLHKFPKRDLPEKDCRALGDAVFALQCPPGAVILTTNIRDHRPLAEALGKSASTPSEV